MATHHAARELATCAATCNSTVAERLLLRFFPRVCHGQFAVGHCMIVLAVASRFLAWPVWRCVALAWQWSSSQTA